MLRFYRKITFAAALLALLLSCSLASAGEAQKTVSFTISGLEENELLKYRLLKTVYNELAVIRGINALYIPHGKGGGELPRGTLGLRLRFVTGRSSALSFTLEDGQSKNPLKRVEKGGFPEQKVLSLSAKALKLVLEPLKVPKK